MTTPIPDWATWKITVTLDANPSAPDVEYRADLDAVREAITGDLVLLSARDVARMLRYPPPKTGETNFVTIPDGIVELERVREE